MQNGTLNTCRAPYGFRLEHGKLIIHEDEAEIVRQIYEMYLSGLQPREILTELQANGSAPPAWSHRSVEYILQNERYTGNALLQKRYATDTLPRRMAYNHGEKAMYFVQGINDAIVTQETWDAAAQLRKSRTRETPPRSHPLSGIMVCGCCGLVLRPKQVRGKNYMVCRKHEENKAMCPIPQIPEEEIIRASLRLYHKLKHHGAPILNEFLSNLQNIRNHRMLWRFEIVELNKRISDLSSQNQMLAELKKYGRVDPDIFISRSNALAEQLRTAKIEKERILNTDDDNTIPLTRELIAALADGPDYLETFDKEFFGELIEKIIVDSNEQLRFRLKNGLELIEQIERTKR